MPEIWNKVWYYYNFDTFILHFEFSSWKDTFPLHVTTSSICVNQWIDYNIMYLRISDVFELEICELSRAEPSWIFPSRAELADFKMRAEPSWRTLKCELAELDIFRDEVNSSWFFFFATNKFLPRHFSGVLKGGVGIALAPTFHRISKKYMYSWIDLPISKSNHVVYCSKLETPNFRS